MNDAKPGEHKPVSRGGYIVTYTGRKFYALDPQPEDISILDIAHGLAMTCRYAGQIGKFYSVAEHSVLVATNCPVDDRLAGLLHDAAEAYIGDVPSPFKSDISNYRSIENKILKVIFDKYNVKSLSSSIKHVDEYALHTEAAILIPECPWLDPKKVRPYKLACLSPNQAEELFLNVFNSLYAGVR